MLRLSIPLIIALAGTACSKQPDARPTETHKAGDGVGSASGSSPGSADAITARAAPKPAVDGPLIRANGVGAIELDQVEGEAERIPGVELSLQEEDTHNTVAGIQVVAPGPKTAEGFGVGSTFGELRAAYGEPKPDPDTGDLVFAKPFEMQVKFAPPGPKGGLPAADAKVTRIRIGGW